MATAHKEDDADVDTEIADAADGDSIAEHGMPYVPREPLMLPVATHK